MKTTARPEQILQIKLATALFSRVEREAVARIVDEYSRRELTVALDGEVAGVVRSDALVQYEKS